MTLDDLTLSLMAFPQRWDGPSRVLTVNLLMLPVGDPTDPLFPSGKSFVDTTVCLKAKISGTDALPVPNNFVQEIPCIAKPPEAASDLFKLLRQQFIDKGITIVDRLKMGQAPPDSVRILKTLPPSYTSAFPFESPRTSDISTSARRHWCDLQKQAPPPGKPEAKPDNTIAWGQILSYALQQPFLAECLGLIHKMAITVDDGLLADGGYIYFTLDDSNMGNPWVKDWWGNHDKVKSYAAYLPPLSSAGKRQLFAATLMPVVKNPPPSLATAQSEAQQYDDGFAQIVHAYQPVTIDAGTLDTDGIAPGTDAGIQIGWDDEQVTVWLNNQLDLLRHRLTPVTPPNPPSTLPDAPLGVLGYRVDVREFNPDDSTQPWHSLSKVGMKLHFDRKTVDPNKIVTTIPNKEIPSNESWVAPAPVRQAKAMKIFANTSPPLLPLYFAQWTGKSLVQSDPFMKVLADAVSAKKPDTVLAFPPKGDKYPILTGVPKLKYGTDYEFRVRFVDLTGGGPEEGDTVIHKGHSPQTLTRFRRFVPPKSLVVTSSPKVLQYPEKPPAVRRITKIEVRRPRIGYPEALYVDIPDNPFLDEKKLIPLLQEALKERQAVSVPDPDVGSFDVIVEARTPAHDTGKPGTNPGEMDGDFRVIYKVKEIPFPDDDNEPVLLTLDYKDGIEDISIMDLPDSGTVDLPIPASRDIRVRLFPRCSEKENYYGYSEPPTGPFTDFIIRSDAVDETPLFEENPTTQLLAFYFQPGSNLPQLLSQQLNLQQDGLTLSGKPGLRTVFGASGSLRHTLSGDASAITFSGEAELLGHWVVALVLDLERDWTWDGFVKPSIPGSPDEEITPCPPPLSISRDKSPRGVMTIPRVVAPAASGTPGQTPDRSRTRLVFFDAIDPHPAGDTFPLPIETEYTITPTFAKAIAKPDSYTLKIKLPITTPPVQTPRIVSTGIAESPYVPTPDYSATSARDRFLWVEFEESVKDPGDCYFARVLAYGPDPLLAASLLPAGHVERMLQESKEPDLPIDPELVRRIFSGQDDDKAGMEAMTQMVPADKRGVGKSGTFFLLPLPPGLSSESLELFGFWTYEFRVGHADPKNWSTAQGRFGRPLRVTGFQHPAPHLFCSASRTQKGIEASAPYASTVYNGRRLFDFTKGDPQTRIWFMLYAQVLQADGVSYRNVLLARRQGTTVMPNTPAKVRPQQSLSRDPRASTLFTSDDIRICLERLGLPTSNPLSVLAVEILPGSISERYRSEGEHKLLSYSNGEGTHEDEEDTEDPLGRKLGSRRILRTSPLAAVPPVC